MFSEISIFLENLHNQKLLFAPKGIYFFRVNNVLLFVTSSHFADRLPNKRLTN